MHRFNAIITSPRSLSVDNIFGTREGQPLDAILDKSREDIKRHLISDPGIRASHIYTLEPQGELTNRYTFVSSDFESSGESSDLSGIDIELVDPHMVFHVIEENCTRYDIDGIDLDFYRHPHFFRPQMVGDPVTQAHCDVMTGFLRCIRAMTENVGRRRGRPLLVIVRVFDSVDYSRAIGLDVERWISEDLIDMAKDTPGCTGGSVIIAPGGKVLAGPLFDEEGILYADIKLEEVIKGKYEFDVSGHYNRPDVFSFKVNMPD